MEARGWRDPDQRQITVPPNYGRPDSDWKAPAKPVPAGIAPRQRTQTKKSSVTLFPALCVASGLPNPFPEYRFAPKRRWRFDWAWPLAKVALEVDGAVWTQGRHTRGAGFIEDQRKLNAAVLAGWKVLRYTPDRLLEAVEDLKCLLISR